MNAAPAGTTPVAPEASGCPICNGRPRRITQTRTGYQLNRCKDCALVFAHPIP